MKRLLVLVLTALTTVLGGAACDRCSETPEEAARRQQDDQYWQEFGRVFAPIVARHAAHCAGLQVDQGQLAENLARASRAEFESSPLPRCRPGLAGATQDAPCKTTDPALLGFYESGYMGQEFRWSCEELGRIVEGDQPAYVPIVE